MGLIERIGESHWFDLSKLFYEKKTLSIIKRLMIDIAHNVIGNNYLIQLKISDLFHWKLLMGLQISRNCSKL